MTGCGAGWEKVDNLQKMTAALRKRGAEKQKERVRNQRPPEVGATTFTFTEVCIICIDRLMQPEPNHPASQRCSHARLGGYSQSVDS